MSRWGIRDDFASDQFVFDPIPVLVEFLGQRQELIGREERSRRHASILTLPPVHLADLVCASVILFGNI